MKINESHVSLLAEAFIHDPLFTHLFSRNREQSKVLIRFILRRNQLLDGLILTDHAIHPAYVAIIAQPQHISRQSLVKTMRLYVEMSFLLLQLPFHVVRFLIKYDKFITSNVPEMPHYYITMIGVHPDIQGQGIGRKVLQEVHQLASSSAQPCSVALDTENHQNVTYYKKCGYQLHYTQQIEGIRIYCMNHPS